MTDQLPDASDTVEPADTSGATNRAELLIAFLQGSNERCPKCHYHLTDATSTLCPECGHELRLAIEKLGRPPAWFVVGLLGWSSGFGFSLLLTCVSLYQAIRDGYWPSMTDAIPFLVQATGHVFMTYQWWNNSDEVSQWSSLVRWMAVGIGWVVSIATPIVIYEMS